MFKATFLKRNFHLTAALIVVTFVLAYVWPLVFIVGQNLIAVFVLVLIVDWYRLYSIREQLAVERELPLKLSLSDGEDVVYRLYNESSSDIDMELYDELPFQFQHREPIKMGDLAKGEKLEVLFHVQPYERGEYHFGDVHLFYSRAPFYFLQRRITYDRVAVAQVVPSIKQMRQHELQVFSKTAVLSGIRQVRQVGENDEFEHIRQYTHGDNIKAINWKATSRQNQLMVNQYQNSRHQDVYCVLDKGRSMKMPFNGLTLLDYSINSVLSLSNIILKKYDHAGLISFSHEMGSVIKASAKHGQLERISDTLYKETTGFKESNFELLLSVTRRILSRRSIWLFYTNFETRYDLQRHLPYLKLMSKRHLVIVIIFINTELETTSEMDCILKSDIYLKTFAQKAILDKQLIKEELIRNGIQTILTRPSELSINVINKYLEIKAKRMR